MKIKRWNGRSSNDEDLLWKTALFDKPRAGTLAPNGKASLAYKDGILGNEWISETT